ncbi:conserved hypothetical protein [Culex quinquefasciatus]|uniref:Uncharacterized protein n=1 Tax=Culex quinquefasciatus TaxID=7176 RepID=B0WNI9_CULQU|nr:conserved hypothetical protein [Culex quinquefasciatus]|eukprot:XP_001850273.1 conserved hypothetical protein [Culex quinquefasciatus]
MPNSDRKMFPSAAGSGSYYTGNDVFLLEKFNPKDDQLLTSDPVCSSQLNLIKTIFYSFEEVVKAHC